jgi:hypothetical protein
MANDIVARKHVIELAAVAKDIRQELEQADDIMRGLLMALAVTRLTSMLLTEGHLESLKCLHGSPCGYGTDEREGGRAYTNQQVAAFVTQCLIDGDPLNGGHVMIFGGKKYRTKTGWQRMLRLLKVQRLNSLGYAPEDVVETRNHSGSVKLTGKCAAFAECVANGQLYRIDLIHDARGDGRVEVSGNGKDAAACIGQMKGKAEARALARLHQLLTGIDSGEDEAMVSDVVVESTPQWQFSPATNAMFERNIAHAEATTAVQAPPAEELEVLAPEPPTEPDWSDEVAALQGKLSSDQAQLLGDAHADLAQAKSSQQLRTVWEAVNMQMKELKMDSRGVALLTRIKDARKGEVA